MRPLHSPIGCLRTCRRRATARLIEPTECRKHEVEAAVALATAGQRNVAVPHRTLPGGLEIDVRLKTIA
jgi:hypothetical protein